MSFSTLPLSKFNKPSAGTRSSTVFFVLLLLRTPPLPPGTTYIYHSRVVPRPSYFTFLFLRFPIIDIQLRTLFRYILTQTQAALALARTTLLRVVRVCVIPLVTLLSSCDSYRPPPSPTTENCCSATLGFATTSAAIIIIIHDTVLLFDLTHPRVRFLPATCMRFPITDYFTPNFSPFTRKYGYQTITNH